VCVCVCAMCARAYVHDMWGMNILRRLLSL